MTPDQAFVHTTTEHKCLRSQLAAVLLSSTKSRAQVADELTRLTGTRITERQLNNYVAESRGDYRLPAELLLPLCVALDDWSLLSGRVERAGFRMIGPDEEKLISIGRAFVDRAAAQKTLREFAK